MPVLGTPFLFLKAEIKTPRCFLMVPPCGFLFLHFCGSCALKCMGSQTPALQNRRFGNCKIGGCKETANPMLTLCQPCANPSPTFCQPVANLFCQPLSNPLFPWTPGTRLETWVNGFLGNVKTGVFLWKMVHCKATSVASIDVQ